ncbi:MAG: hypothetical protein U1F68_09825 [Gammaproteobacteria bacterium]
MSNVTLIITRKPFLPFQHGKRQGRWGKMLVIEGPTISGAALADSALGAAKGAAVNISTAEGERELRLDADGAVGRILHFDSMERHGGYVQLTPNADSKLQSAPFYRLKMEINDLVRTTFEQNGIKDHNGGQCLRVHEHNTKKANGVTAGILVHEAPHVGFLTGCIAPGKKQGSRFGGSSRKAMQDIFQLMGGFKIGKAARLIVLDW